MKKLIILSAILISCSFANSQVRFSEFSAVSGENYIELYSSKTVDLNAEGYWIVTFTTDAQKNITSRNILSLTGTISATIAPEPKGETDRYFMIVQKAPVLTSPGKTIYSTYDLIWNSAIDFVENGGSSAMFLFKKDQLVDLFVTQASQKEASVVLKNIGQQQFPKAGLFTGSEGYIDPITINFQNIQVTRLNYIVSAATGGKSYQLLVSNTNCGRWSPETPTPETTNKDANLGIGDYPEFVSFKSELYFSGPNGLVQVAENGNVESLNYSLQSNPFGIKLSYVVSDYYDPSGNVTPTIFQPGVTIFYDFDGDFYLDETIDKNLLTTTSSTISYSAGAPVYDELLGGFRFDFVILNPNKAQLINKNLFFQFETLINGKGCFYQIERLIVPQALPVTIKNLLVKSVILKNNLTWTTSTEQNNKGFEVQKSVGNGQDFRTIGFVGTRAKDGNSNTDISYSFEDADIKAGTMHYYRLKQVDFDGKFTYSIIKSIKPGSIESNLTVYPNPSQGSFTLTTGAASGKVNVFLLDNTGRVINQYMNVSASNTKFNNLKKGFYTLKIVDVETGEQSAQRVVVQ